MLTSIQSRTNASVRGQSAATIHKDYKSLASEFLDFKTGVFLNKYLSEITKREKKGRVELPPPTTIFEVDEDCIIVQSFRYSSVSGLIFSLLQLFVKSYRVGEANHKGEGCDIVFWTISKEEVPNSSSVSTNLQQSGLKLVENAYYERGNFNLSYLPHSQSRLIYNVEIGFDN